MRAISVRDFMRGGYKQIMEPTVVTKHGRPVFTVLPPWLPVDIGTIKDARSEAKTSSR
jgi:hypothetical protein